MKKRLIIPLVVLAVVVLLVSGAAAATPAEIAASIDKGIDWLVSQQNADGSWHSGSQSGDRYGTTGLVVVKLEDLAWEQGKSPFDPTYAYKAQVEKGLEYLFNQADDLSLSLQGGEDPNGDGDNLGVSVGTSTYNTGIFTMAVAASRSPARTVTNGPLNGWTYGDVVQDAADWIAWGQADTGNCAGGWYYGPQNNGGSCDQSNSGYAMLGLLYATSPVYGFNANVQPFVKTRLNTHVDWIQSADGGAGYTAPDYWENSLKTGTLLQQMAFVGDTSATVRVQQALAYIGAHWNQDWVQGWGKSGPTEYQSTYALMKGFEVVPIPLNGVPGVANWYQDMANDLLSEQNAEGSWPSSPAYVWYYGTPSHYVSKELSTVWALLTLERFAPPIKPQCDDGADNDGDTLVDMADPGCDNPQDNSEYNANGVPEFPTLAVPAAFIIGLGFIVVTLRGRKD